MDYFPNIKENWNIIAHRPVETSRISFEEKANSISGRFTCLMHTLATPLKAFSKLGKLVLSTILIAMRTFAVITLNAHPKALLYAAAGLIDVSVGAALLPIALVANVIRGVIGTLFHPGAMIKSIPIYYFHLNSSRLDHNILHGTLINY